MGLEGTCIKRYTFSITNYDSEFLEIFKQIFF